MKGREWGDWPIGFLGLATSVPFVPLGIYFTFATFSPFLQFAFIHSQKHSPKFASSAPNGLGSSRHFPFHHLSKYGSGTLLFSFQIRVQFQSPVPVAETKSKNRILPVHFWGARCIQRIGERGHKPSFN